MSFATCNTTQEAIRAIAKEYDSFYLYGQREIQTAAQHLKANFPGVTFLYSAKNNPCKTITATLHQEGFGTDAASLAEAVQSAALGTEKQHIHYSAPGKTDRDIAAALPIATLVADSVQEVLRIERIAATQNIVAEIGIRIHPAISFADGTLSAPSKFGIEEAQAFAQLSNWNTLQHVQIVGLHVHCRSQCLCATQITTYHKNVLDLANRLQAALSRPLQFLNMGAGLGIPYAPEDTALDLASIAASTNAAIAAFHAQSPSTHLYIETGRYCVGNNGVYVSKVLDKKTCGDKTYLILANTLNGFIRPSLANVLQQNTLCPSAAEPLYTTKNAFAFYPLCCNETVMPSQSPQETVTLVGNLCTATDLLAEDITLPALTCGDVIITTNAGSYAAVLSPMQFSQQVPPAQLFLQEDGTVVDA